MAGLGLNIAVTDALVPGIERAIEAGRDFTAPMAEIANTLLTNARDRFARQVSPVGVPWEPSKDAIEEGRATLYKRGDLFNALDKRSDATSAEMGVLQTGGPAIYAGIHNWGGTIRPRTAKALKTPFGPRASVKMPQRQFVGLSPEDIDEAVEILAAPLFGAIGGSA